MNIQFTDSFRKKAQKLTKKDGGLSFILKKQFNLFNSNPRHPSLHLHKLQGKRSEQLAIKMISSLILRLGFPPKKDNISETNSSRELTLGVFLGSAIKPNLRALAIKSNKIKDTFIFFDLVTHDEY